MLIKYPLHPFLFGLFPIVYLFAGNPGQILWPDMWLPLVVMELITGIVLLIAYSVSKNWATSAVYVSVLMFWFYSYGCFYNIFIGLTLNNIVIGRERWLIPIWGLLFIFGLVCLIRFRRGHQDFNRALNVVMPVLIGLLLLNAGFSYYNPHSSGQNVRSKTYRLATVDTDNAKPEKLPSIYYIILDSYSASSVLKDIYGCDNGPFLDYLKKKGFYVAEKSCSNYAATSLSLPSSLNLDYLDAIFDISDRQSRNFTCLRRGIEDSDIATYLSRRGYEIVRLGSWWAPTAAKKEKSDFASCIATDFNIALLQMTILRPIVEDMMAPLLRREILSAFDRMADLARSDRPHFVFAHIICPHPPYIFGADGEEIGLFQRVTSRLNHKISYSNQVKYVNKKVESLVDALLKDLSSPPIIILQADHGSGFIFHPMHNKSVPGNTEQDIRFLKTQFKILNAYYLPNGGEKYLYGSISPVNTFRVVMNAYFGGHLELLPDRCIYSNYSSPYNFLDVTDRVQN